MSETLAATWGRLERWLAAHAPRALASLNPPASEDEIAQAERALGVALPGDVRASLRRHDGQEPDIPLFAGWSLLPCRRVVAEWRVWKDLLDAGRLRDREAQAEGAVRAEWWNPRWIPITGDGTGDHHCVDLSPAPGGTSGQVITMWHDSGRRRVVAPAFESWLCRIADDLASGGAGP